MTDNENMLPVLYKKLLKLYPQEFREQLAESMEQTFNDHYLETRKAQQGLFGFTVWTFTETAIGIFREYLVLISPGDVMQTILKPLGSSTLVSLLLILPFMIMEVVNRRHFNEEFPFALFFGLWLNTFAVSSILLPIMRAKQIGKHDMVNPVPTQGNIASRSEAEWTLLSNPKSTLMISIALILFLVILSLLDSLGWGPLERLLNGPNSEQNYVFGIQVPSLLIVFVLFSFPIMAGIIAGRPIVSTLRAGGGLFAHPIHLIIVIVISFLFVSGVVSLIIDQWPCFIGVPNCD